MIEAFLLISGVAFVVTAIVGSVVSISNINKNKNSIQTRNLGNSTSKNVERNRTPRRENYRGFEESSYKRKNNPFYFLQTRTINVDYEFKNVFPDGEGKIRNAISDGIRKLQ